MSRWIVAFFILIFATPIAVSHPHVWIEGRTELIFDNNDHFIAVRHVWRFDEGFSAYATQGLDENGDGKLSREELTELAQINVESLADFEYFTYVQMGKDDPKYVAPSEYWLQHEDGLLTLFFTLPMEKPVTPHNTKGFKDLTVEVFDPTFFVDIGFVKEDPIATLRLDGTVSQCQAALERRPELDIIQSQLLSQIGPDEAVPEEIAPSEGELSNTIRVSCSSS